MKASILVLDFGSQYTQLIARRIRDMGVYTEVLPYYEKIINSKEIKGIILSGGPASVYEKNAPMVKKELFDLNIPILGICYGMQLISYLHNGEVKKASKQEFGKAKLMIDEKNNLLFKNIENNKLVWMSHADHIKKMPVNFIKIAHSENSISAIYNSDKNIYGVQFHPEVTHTEIGNKLLNNFVFEICKCIKNWSIKNFIEETIKEIKNIVKDEKVILGLSGGVDSSISALLIQKAIKDNLTCIFVDTGLLRLNEGNQVINDFGKYFNLNIKRINAEKQFLSKLKNIEEPEKKRKIIGQEFINIFNKEAKKIKNISFLAQGTIYPDVIESVSIKGPSKVIKSHHNVGGLPKKLNFKLLEPLRKLFKDEVRKVGLELGIKEKFIFRHPFPGPGLGIRIIGKITKEKADILREVDNIFIDELYKNKLYNKVSQAFATILPCKTVGVMGDIRTYDYLVAIRSVNTNDFMTASITRFDFNFLENVATRIVNEVKGVNRIVYDITSKPPGTIEWE